MSELVAQAVGEALAHTLYQQRVFDRLEETLAR
jgi:hypothetical protein